MFCPGCGKSLPDESTFCSGCGKKLTTIPTSAPVNSKFIVTTTNSIDGYAVKEYISTVTGTDIYLVGGILGGGMANQEKLFGTAYQNALNKMMNKAKEKNANAIIGISLNFTGAANTGSVIVALIGTAVKVEKKSDN